MLGEQKCLILTSLDFPKMKYIVHAGKYKPLLRCRQSLKPDQIKIFCYKMAGENNF